MKVLIESAGDHRFDLTHLRQEGAEELLELALHKASFHEHQWRLQVQKKVTCHSETRPLAVVGYKPWCCYVKIKPGDNNSGHFCTLLMPAGLRGEDVYRALKTVEDQIDRNWRFASEARTRANGTSAHLEAGAVNGPATVPDERPDLDAWLNDPEKAKLVLLAVHEVARRGPHSSPAAFGAALAEELGWRNVSGSAMNGVFAALLRRGHVAKRMDEARHVGYQLSGEGRDVIRDLLPPLAIVPAAGPPVELAFDPAELLRTLHGLAQEYAESVRKLREARERRARLQAEVEQLDAEIRDLERKLHKPEVQTLMRRLAHLGRQPS